MTSSVPGNVQVYYDSGGGFRESDSTTVPLAKSDKPILYRLHLPEGSYRAFRFDPIDRDGTVTIAKARVADRSGRTVRELTASAFKPAHQIQSIRESGGRLEVVMTPRADDPQLFIELAQPVVLPTPWGDIAGTWLERAGAAFAAFAVLLLALDRSARLRALCAGMMRMAAARPGLALALTAGAAVIASAYPVVFLGKSFVGPNIGSILLYDDLPTLPGYADKSLVDVKGSDVGAIMWQGVPYSAVQHRALLRDGEIPVWNRYDSAGTPLLGQGQSMFGDPLHFLVVAADGAAWAWDIKYLAAKWLLALGLGSIVLALTRRLGPALLISLGAPFLGFFIYRLNHPAFFSLCYAPWPLYCWIRTAQPAGWRSFFSWAIGLLLADLALMLSGTAKEAYMLLLSLNLAGVCVLLASRAPWRERLLKLAGLAGMGVLFAALTAPVWLSFLETLRVSYTSYNAASAFQVQPGMLLGAFDEAFFRPLEMGERLFNPSANFLVLAGLLYFLATLRQQFADRAVTALAAFSLLPLSLAFGFVPPEWIKGVPFLANVAHIDNTFTCVLIVLWSVLAGVGFATASRRLGTPEGRGDLIVAGLLLFALVFQFVAFRQAVHRPNYDVAMTFTAVKIGQTVPMSPFVRGYLAVLLAALVALGLLARAALRRGSATPALGGGIALCLLALLWRFGQEAASGGFEDYVVRPAPRVDFHAKSGAVRWIQNAVAKEPGRSVGLQNNLFPGWSAMYGLEGINGPDALINPRYRELTLLSPIDRAWDWRMYLSRGNLAQSRPFLDFLNTRYYLDLRSDQAALGAVLKLDRTGDLDVYESTTAWPRAFFTDRVALYRDAPDFMALLGKGDGRPFAAAQDSDSETRRELGGLAGSPLGGRAVVPATDYRLTEDSTSFSVDAPAAGIAVLSEAYWPGYPHGEVDGRTAKVIRINHAFEGIPVSAGRHRITVSYRPRNFGWMLLAAGASLAAMGLMAASVRLFRMDAPRAWLRRRTARECGLAIAAIAFGLLAWRQVRMVDLYTSNLMFQDQWWYYQNLAEHGSWWSSFAFQLGPHRMGAGLLVTRILADLSGWNSRWDAFAVSFALIAAAGLAWKLARRCGVPAGAGLAAIPLLFFNSHEYAALTETANLSHGAMPVFLIVLFALAGFSSRAGRRLSVQAVLAFLLIFTGFGIFMGIVAPLLFSIEAVQAWRSGDRWRFGWAAAALAIVAAAWVLFLHHYEFTASIPDFRFPYERPHEYLLFIAIMLANFFGVAHAGPIVIWLGAAAAAAIVAAACAHGYRVIRQGVAQEPASAAIFCLATYEIVYLVNTAIGRVMLGLDGAPLASRYVVLIIPGVLAVFLAMGGCKPARLGSVLVLAFAALLVPATAFLRSSEKETIERFAAGRQMWRNVYLETHSEAEARARAHFDIFVAPIPDRLRYLEEHRLNLFHDQKTR
jgi:hypothetical protein